MKHKKGIIGIYFTGGTKLDNSPETTASEADNTLQLPIVEEKVERPSAPH